MVLAVARALLGRLLDEIVHGAMLRAVGVVAKRNAALLTHLHRLETLEVVDDHTEQLVRCEVEPEELRQMLVAAALGTEVAGLATEVVLCQSKRGVCVPTRG